MKRILIVDDIDAHSALLKNILDKQGYECIQCSSAIEALCKAHNEHFDLVIMDLAMPVMSGVDCIKYLKKFYNNSVIAITGYATIDTIEEAKMNGVDDIWIKPVSIQTIIDKVEKVLE